MSHSLSEFTVPVFVRGLTVLSTLLEKAEAHAVEQGIAAEALLGARLASDMLPLTAQVQRASDTSKFAVQRISGGEAPRFADEERTFAQLQERISRTISYLKSVDASQINTGATRRVALKWGPASGNFSGARYLSVVALPNFYFHVVTAYDILRNQGVKVGKLDFLGPFDTAPEVAVSGGPAPGLILNNVAIAVHDLQRMAEWYERVLGFAAVERGTFDAVGADYAMLEGAGTRLELVTIGGERPVPADRTSPPGHLNVLGYKALVFDAEDLQTVTQALEKHDVEFVWADIQLTPERRSTMIRDPEGNMIHFFGPLQ